MARKQQRGDRPTTPTTGGVDPNLALFASYVREGEQRERDAKKAAREARQEAEATERLVAAKDAAAAEVKRLRGREGVSSEQRAAADAAYRDALAAVVAAETGEAPAWAPPAPVEPEVDTDTVADAGDDAVVEAETEAGDDAVVEAETGTEVRAETDGAAVDGPADDEAVVADEVADDVAAAEVTPDPSDPSAPSDA